MPGAARAPILSRRALLLGSAGLALVACDDTSARAPDELRIATGPPGAVYRAVGAALAGVLAERLPDTRVRAIPTGASVDNLRLLHQGGTDLAFASLDATLAGLAKGVPETTAAIARLYDSFLQLVVRSDGPIMRLPDLAGRTVSIGARGSGTEFITGRVLTLAGVSPRTINLNQTDSSAALAEGRIDAFFTLTGVPTPAITDLLRRVKLRLIALGDLVKPMNDRYGEHYAPATIPSSAYIGLPANESMTVANLLLARPSLDAGLVEAITAALFAERARIGRGHPEANRINVRTGIATGPVPLHPGAARYYRSVKP